MMMVASSQAQFPLSRAKQLGNARDPTAGLARERQTPTGGATISSAKIARIGNAMIWPRSRAFLLLTDADRPEEVYHISGAPWQKAQKRGQ